MCGHSSRRSVTARAHQRPTRRFRHLLEPPGRIGQIRKSKPGSWLAFPSLFGLAPCGVYPASGVTVGAVRSYRTFSPLPRRRISVAVCFLWHWPSTGLNARIPDVIRHTALWSSDFPLPDRERPSGPAAILFIIFDQPSCAVLPASSHDR